jgi:carboxyl-terminal processing protease
MGDTSYGQLSVFNEVVRIVLDAYVEPVNLDRAMAGAELGLTDALDGDSAFLDAEEYKAYQQPAKETDADIGAVLCRRFSFLMVVTTRPESPAAKAGLKTGDVLKSIDGRHTRPISIATGDRLLRGAPGSIVKLKVLRAGAGNEPLDISVVRERLVPATPRAKVLDDGTGYLKVSEFGTHAADGIRGELESLKKSGARRLVLDLRGAAFGGNAEGVKVAELFVSTGLIGKLSGRKVAEQVFKAEPTNVAWNLPVATLVDTGSAGPAEVVAAALLDAGQPVVGERTLGRAGIQKAVPLPEGALLLTVAKYVSPKGTPIHGKGVEPSVPAEGPSEEAGEPPSTADPVLEKALEVLKTEQKKAA